MAIPLPIRLTPCRAPARRLPSILLRPAPLARPRRSQKAYLFRRKLGISNSEDDSA
jgi:hypothetical protein